MNWILRVFNKQNEFESSENLNSEMLILNEEIAQLIENEEAIAAFDASYKNGCIAFR